jgi:hypothetical protein
MLFAAGTAAFFFPLRRSEIAFIIVSESPTAAHFEDDFQTSAASIKPFRRRWHL